MVIDTFIRFVKQVADRPMKLRHAFNNSPSNGLTCRF